MVIEEVRCTGPCSESKPVGEFWFDERANRRLRRCRKCTNAGRRKLYKKNPEPHKKAGRVYRAENPDKVRESKRKYATANKNKVREWQRKSAIKSRESHNRKCRERWSALRVEVIVAYGGKCHCCSEPMLAFLNLDHVAQDGAEHRKNFNGSNVGVYRWAKANNYPPSLRVACFNCNIASYRNNGICPHQMGKLELVRMG